MTTIQESTAMTGAEFRTLREYLGLTNKWLADYLGVAERSVNRWGDGVAAPPPGVVADMLELRDIAAAAVADGVRLIADEGLTEWPTWRTDAAVKAVNPKDPYPASWHRSIAARIWERVPALRLAFADPEL